MPPSHTLVDRITAKFPSGKLNYFLLSGLALVAVSTVAAIFVPSCYPLTVFGDVLQFFLVAVVAFLFTKNASTTQGSTRVFWALLALSFAIWTASLAFWVYFEVWLKQPTPDFPFSDLLLFLKLAPLLMALALEPQKKDSLLSRVLGFLDLSLLMIYWLYLYAFWVSVYHAVPYALQTYNFHYDAIDAFGNQLVLLAAGFIMVRSRQPWRKLYQYFFVSSAFYCVASDLSNIAIDRGVYYTGSLYDVPLVASLVGFVWMGLFGAQMVLPDPLPAEDVASTAPEARKFSYWTSHLGMVVTLSTPLIGLYLLLARDMRPDVKHYRIQATLITMLLLTLLLIVKQSILSSYLARSLSEVSESYSSLTRFKDQLLQSDKLVSLGQLVAGVANEIRKAMDEILHSVAHLTANSRIDSAALVMASKIDQYASRTNNLVDGMLSFARETPSQKNSLSVNSLLEGALTLSRAAKNRSVRAVLTLEPMVPHVAADAGQLLQVFMNVIGNAADAMEASPAGELRISTKLSGDHVIIEFADSGTGLKEPDRVFEPFYTTKPVGKGTGLGLSTCYGIVRGHGGEIVCRNNPEGGAIFTIILPCLPPSPESIPVLGEFTLRGK
ncbi:MAG TPA: ATP-binding protein [Candidatus Dormibacteraeota bacterium]|nr:ATP-binding protein [Candidatus Dormibacteraeota bacterium]